MERLNNYLNFAEDDYLFFKESYEQGSRRNALASMSQNICEKYLKHIISEYANPDCQEEAFRKQEILRTHSLRKLIRYIENEMGIAIPRTAKSSLHEVDGFYFTTRYPGDESFFASPEDIDSAFVAIENTRAFTLETIRAMEMEH